MAAERVLLALVARAEHGAEDALAVRGKHLVAPIHHLPDLRQGTYKSGARTGLHYLVGHAQEIAQLTLCSFDSMLQI